MDNGYPMVEMSHPDYLHHEQSKKSPLPLIAGVAAIIIIATVGIVVGIVANTSTDGEVESDGDEIIAETDEAWEIENFEDFSEKSERLNARLAELVKTSPYADYTSTSTEVDNSNNLFNHAKDAIVNNEFDSFLSQYSENITTVQAMNSNILNYYLDRGDIVIIDADGEAPYTNSPVVIFGGSPVDGLYSVYHKAIADGENQAMYTKLDLFNNITGDAKFYAVTELNHE